MSTNEVMSLKSADDIKEWLIRKLEPVSIDDVLVDKNGDSWNQLYGFKRYHYLHGVFKRVNQSIYAFDVRELDKKDEYIDWYPNSSVSTSYDELLRLVTEAYFINWKL